MEQVTSADPVEEGAIASGSADELNDAAVDALAEELSTTSATVDELNASIGGIAAADEAGNWQEASGQQDGVASGEGELVSEANGRRNPPITGMGEADLDDKTANGSTTDAQCAQASEGDSAPAEQTKKKKKRRKKKRKK